jgi:hypothetical protein
MPDKKCQYEYRTCRYQNRVCIDYDPAGSTYEHYCQYNGGCFTDDCDRLPEIMKELELLRAGKVGDLIYLATPYSHPDPAMREGRYLMACKAASALLQQGLHVFSPIAHTHQIAQYGLPTGWDFWESYDRLYLDRCDALYVLKMDGWEESVGVQAEIRIMEEMGKPVTYLEWPIGEVQLA